MISQRFESSPDISVESLRLADVSPRNPDRVAEAVMAFLDTCNFIRCIDGAPVEVAGLDFYCTPDGRVNKVEVNYRSNC